MEKNKYYICDKCKKSFVDYSLYEKHLWQNHPSDKYQKAWANMNWSSYRGSSYYMDDPYY